MARADAARARRVAPLDHEIVDHTVEDHTVVEAVLRELLEIFDSLRRVLIEELDVDGAVVCLQRCIGHANTITAA